MVQTETKEEKPIVVDKPFRLLEVNVEPRYDSNHERSFTGGEVRNEIKKIFEPSATYHLFTTAANPKAKERLDEIAREETRTKEHSHSRFGSALTYLYQHALHAFAGKEGIVHAYFDLVDQDIFAPPHTPRHPEIKFALQHLFASRHNNEIFRPTDFSNQWLEF